MKPGFLPGFFFYLFSRFYLVSLPGYQTKTGRNSRKEKQEGKKAFSLWYNPISIYNYTVLYSSILFYIPSYAALLIPLPIDYKWLYMAYKPYMVIPFYTLLYPSWLLSFYSPLFLSIPVLYPSISPSIPFYKLLWSVAYNLFLSFCYHSFPFLYCSFPSSTVLLLFLSFSSLPLFPGIISVLYRFMVWFGIVY